MSNYIPPQLVIQQEFASVPSAITEPLQLCIVGPSYRVFDYSNTTDNALVSFGAYNPSTGLTAAYGALPAGSIVDQSSAQLVLENLLAKYLTISGSNAIEIGSSSNRISLGTGTTGGFASNSYASRAAAFKNRDVKVGDRIKITGTGISYTTTVANLVADVVAASAGAVSQTGNPATVTKLVTPSTIVTNGDHTSAENTATTLYIGNLAKGVITDTYTLTCITGGAGTAAAFSVSSLNGDNVASVQAAALGSPISVGTAGLRVTISGTGNYVLGETYQFVCRAAYTQKVPTVTGSTYTGLYNTTYKVTVVKGGLWAQGPQVVVSTNNGVDYLGAQTVASNTSFNLGTLGATILFPTAADQGGLNLGDVYYVTLTAASAGAIRTLIVADPLPSGAAGDDLSVDFYIYRSSFAFPRKGYPDFGSSSLTANTSTFTVPASLYVSDPTWTDVDGVTLIDIPVVSGNIFVPYRALLTSGANQLSSLSDISVVNSVLGSAVPSNPLSYAVYQALLNSNGQPVNFVPVATDDLSGYTAALHPLESSDIAYFIVPLSSSQDVINLVKGHVDSLSGTAKQKERIAIVSEAFNSTVTLYNLNGSGTAWTGYVSGTGSPTVYTQVTVPGATFIDSGIRAGDVLNSNFTADAYGNPVYQSAVIASVTDQQHLVLVSPGFSAAVGSSGSLQRISITRTLSKDEQATAIAAASSALGDRRVYNVWPDQLVDASGVTVAGFHAAAAIGALKSSVAPQQGITNYALNGFSSVLRSTGYFTPTQLNTIAGGGTLVLSQDTANGPIYIRHQISTDQTDVNHAELSVTTNLDSITKYLRSDLIALQGKYNRTANFLQLVDVTIRSRITYLQTQTTTVTAGAQIESFDPTTGLSVVGDPVLRTLTDVRVQVGLPYPNNNTNVTLVVL